MYVSQSPNLGDRDRLWPCLLLVCRNRSNSRDRYQGGCYRAGMRRRSTGLAHTGQARHELCPPHPSQGAGVTPLVPSVPRSRYIRLAKRKAQGSVADGVFHHRMVAPQGVGAFSLGDPSSLRGGQGFGPYHSSPHPSSPASLLFITPLHFVSFFFFYLTHS